MSRKAHLFLLILQDKGTFMKQMKNENNWRYLWFLKRTALVFIMTLFLANQTSASLFKVNPVRIFLDPQTRIEKLTLTNSNDEDLNVQIKVYQWTQDEKGQDIYLDTSEVIIFPKMASLKKDEEKIIRIGTNQKSGPSEKTYRLYVEEIPSAEKAETKNPTVHMFMRIGIPIFLSPVKKEEKGAIETITVQKGKTEFKVKNTGNKHLLLSAVQVRGVDNQGKEIFSKNIGGWYLLTGTSKVFETNLPKDVCRDINSLNVEVKTDTDYTLKEQFQVQKTMCGQNI